MNDIKLDCMISTDCTNCHCNEPYPASHNMYSKKFNGQVLNLKLVSVSRSGTLFG